MQWSVFLLILMGQCSFFTCHLYEYHFIQENKTWDEAKKYCRENYADLATVANMTDMKRLVNHMNQSKAWIGLNNPTDGADNWKWHWSLPGVEYNKSKANWHQDELNDMKSHSENCAFIRKKDLTWEDIACEKEVARFLCYDESAKSIKSFYLIEEKKNWLDAQSYCRDKHTDLVSGLNQLEDEELKKVMKPETVPLIGLFSDSWRWSDGSSFSFRHWGPNFNNKEEQRKCAMLDGNGRWKNADCNETKPFFCYDDNVILIQENKTWEEALYYCRENHHELVSITNLNEQRWIQERAKNASSPYVWLGLRYTCTLDFWFWVSDKLVCYKNWASQMNECDMSGAMDRGGQHQWFSQPDNEKYNFICSKF